MLFSEWKTRLTDLQVYTDIPTALLRKAKEAEATFSYTFNTDLKMGMRGDDVMALQKALTFTGDFYKDFVGDLQPTGYFGAVTLTSVKRYQTRNGLPSTGYVGKLTRGKLNDAYGKKKTLVMSSKGLDLLKAFEGCVLHAYKDQVGVWTIGYGNTYMPDGTRVTATTPPITLATAEAMLRNSLAKVYEPTVRKAITVPLTQNQYDACVSFCYNLGSMRTVADVVNKGGNVRAELVKYVYAKGVKLHGLVVRREKEADLFYANN
jgi:lysozyme